MAARTPAARIKGQEVSVLISRDGELESTLTEVQDLNAEAQFEIKTQGFLGEKTNRKDYIFNGMKGDMTIQLHAQDYFKYFAAQIDKAKRNTPDVVFNIQGLFAFPNGDTPQLLLSDVSFGPQPMNIPSRGDYVKIKIEFECDDISIQTS